MTTSGFQAALAHVLVHRDVRERLLEHGRDLQTKFELTDEEVRILQTSSPSRLRVTASTIGSKRIDFLRRALPKASSVLGGGCQCSLMPFVDACPPFEADDGNQVNRLIAEAERFIDYLKDDHPSGAPLYAEDLARYELMRLRLSYSAEHLGVVGGEAGLSEDVRLQLGRHVLLGEFTFDVVSLWEEQALPETAVPRRTRVALVKTAPRKFATYRVGPVVFRMLESWQAPGRPRDLRRTLTAQLGSGIEQGFEEAARFALREGILVGAAPE